MLICNAFSLNMLDTLDVDVRVRPLTLIQAQAIAANGLESAVGHADTAAVFSAELGVEVPANRVTLTLGSGDMVLVGQYRGPRLTEGATELPNGARIEWAIVELWEPSVLADDEDPEFYARLAERR